MPAEVLQGLNHLDPVLVIFLFPLLATFLLLISDGVRCFSYQSIFKVEGCTAQLPSEM